MKTKARLLLLINITLLSLMSCNEPLVDVGPPPDSSFRWTYSKFARYAQRTHFGRYGSKWDEVEYKVSDPSQYTIFHYVLESDESYSYEDGLKFYLYCDSSLIGTIIYNRDFKIFFAKTGDTKYYTLYDFQEIWDNSDGWYHGWAGNDEKYIPPMFYRHEDTDEECVSHEENFKTMREKYPAEDLRWFWDWVDDRYGGKTITGLGSTAGILTPIIGIPAPGYKRELLQSYYMYGGPYEPLYGYSHLMIKKDGLIYDGGTYYINYESPVVDYLPEEAWVQPWAIEKYKEYKDNKGTE